MCKAQSREVPLLSRETLLEPFPMCPFSMGGWCLGDNWGTVYLP